MRRASRGKGGGGGGGGGGGRGAFERVPGVALRDFGCILEVPGAAGVAPRPTREPEVQVRSLRGDARGGGWRWHRTAPRRAARALWGLGAIRGRTRKEGRERTAGNGDGRRRVPVQRPVHRQAPLERGRAVHVAQGLAVVRRGGGFPDAGKPKPSETSRTSLFNLQRVPSTRPLRVPYVSLWTALDDVDATNGCVRVLPYPAARELEIHEKNASRRLDVLSRKRWREDLSDRERDEAAAAFRDVRVCVMRAGDTLCMSDRVLHCSGPNASGALRRAWMPQFSKRAIRKRDGEPTALAVPARSVGNTA